MAWLCFTSFWKIQTHVKCQQHLLYGPAEQGAGAAQSKDSVLNISDSEMQLCSRASLEALTYDIPRALLIFTLYCLFNTPYLM